MEKHCGRLERVGDLTGGQMVGGGGSAARVATQVDSIQIGATVLKKPRCEDALFQVLEPGRDACLYVMRHGRTTVIMGVKYADGTKYLISKTYLRGSLLQLATIIAFMYWLGGLAAGGIIGSMIGFGDYTPVLAMLAGTGAGGWAWYQAYQFWQDYSAARAD